MPTPRESGVLNAVVMLVDNLLDDFDVVELLTDLTEQCAELVDVDAAGLLLAGPRGELRLMAATSKRSRELELLQLHADEGPCLDCFATGEPVSVADLRAEQHRWPRFVAAATEAGFHSVHAVPMRAAKTVLGALGLFGTRAGTLSDDDLLVARTLAHVACVALLQQHPPTLTTIVAPLQAAMTDRVVVDQAIGFVSERLGITLGDSFDLLRRYARTHATHLTSTARQLITEPDRREHVITALRTLASP